MQRLRPLHGVARERALFLRLGVCPNDRATGLEGLQVFVESVPVAEFLDGALRRGDDTVLGAVRVDLLRVVRAGEDDQCCFRKAGGDEPADDSLSLGCVPQKCRGRSPSDTR